MLGLTVQTQRNGWLLLMVADGYNKSGLVTNQFLPVESEVNSRVDQLVLDSQ